MGHGYFLEDGGEKYNIFDGNLAMSTRKGTGNIEPVDQKYGFTVLFFFLPVFFFFKQYTLYNLLFLRKLLFLIVYVLALSYKHINRVSTYV